MTRTRIALLALALAALVFPAAAAAKKTYYVSLGDSYAAGYQPNGVKNQGFTDHLYKSLHKKEPGCGWCGWAAAARPPSR
jgi:hypothetical protein